MGRLTGGSDPAADRAIGDGGAAHRARRRNRLGDGLAIMGALTEGVSRVSRVLSDEQGGGRLSENRKETGKVPLFSPFLGVNDVKSVLPLRPRQVLQPLFPRC
jgi:hypothetical protein